MNFDNVFVLGTGRCGTMTLSKVFSHCTNWTVAHESRVDDSFDRFAYPKNHIEIDNRLSWFLGGLDQHHDRNRTLYIHLRRGLEPTVESYSKRWQKNFSLMRAVDNGLLQPNDRSPEEVAEFAVQQVWANVNMFFQLLLKTNGHCCELFLDHPEFPSRVAQIWDHLGCRGDLRSAMRELNIKHNASRP